MSPAHDDFDAEGRDRAMRDLEKSESPSIPPEMYKWEGPREVFDALVLDARKWRAQAPSIPAGEPPLTKCRCGAEYDVETGVCNRSGILVNHCDSEPAGEPPEPSILDALVEVYLNEKVRPGMLPETRTGLVYDYTRWLKKELGERALSQERGHEPPTEPSPEICPNCGGVPYFRCGQCNEEWFTRTQSLAHSQRARSLPPSPSPDRIRDAVRVVRQELSSLALMVPVGVKAHAALDTIDATVSALLRVDRGVDREPLEELKRFAEGDTRPVAQTYTTAGEGSASLTSGPTDEQLLDAFVVGCNAENELNDAELSPQNVRKGVAAAMRAKLGASLPSGSLRDALEAVQRLKARAPFATGTNYLLDLDTIEAALGPSEPAPEGSALLRTIEKKLQSTVDAGRPLDALTAAAILTLVEHAFGVARLSQGGQE